MELVAVMGSPRPDGISSQIADRVLQGVTGYKIHRYDVGSFQVRGCMECFHCRNKKTDTCAVRDDLSEVLEKTKTADVLVVSTPVFYDDVSGPLKCFIDRTWSYFGIDGTPVARLPKNRDVVLILSYGYEDPSMYDGLWERYKTYFSLYGFERCHVIKAYGAYYGSPGIANQAEVDRRIGEVVDQISQSAGTV